MVQVPAATNVTVLPLTVQIVADREEKPTASPDVAVALSENAASPMTLLLNAAKLIVCVVEILKVRSTSAAAEYVAFPACDARMVHVPLSTIVTEKPLAVQTAVVRDARTTGRPEDAVTTTVNGGPNHRLSKTPKVML